MSATSHPSVGIVGGGLAGLAAACALADCGFRVTVLERRPYLGGRASSYQHPGTGEVVDNCQHVLLGCCTNLLDFYRRTGVAGKIRWFDSLTFIEPGGRQTVMTSSFLPAPLHSAPSFFNAQSLGLREKFAIARGLTRLSVGLPKRDESFLTWLHRHRQPPLAIERFWKVVLVSALNEDLDCMSARYAAQVFRESFLKSRQAGLMGVPSVPLTGLYDASAEYIRGRGGDVRVREPVDALAADPQGCTLRTAREELRFDFVVLATPWDAAARLLPETLESLPLHRQLSQFRPSPITGVHLWFDRIITVLPHAVLLDRTIQWMFHKSELLGKPDSSYVELVVSSSRSLVEKQKGEIVDLALKELTEFFPAAAQARLLKSTVIKEVNATWSPMPGCDSYRPPQETPWPTLFLAGDWTATGWPATMEGAVRSGYLAAEALTSRAGSPRKLLVPDLPARGFMRWIR